MTEEKIMTPRYDKSRWSKGEWDNEPDRQDFIHVGFSCLVLRNHNGNWCGYVGVPNGHSCYKKDYDDVDVDVHGGLTYADKCSSHICHIPQPNMPDDVWWLGFDTGHSMDLSPNVDLNIFDNNVAVYRNLDYIINETKRLAEQLAKL